MALEPKLLRMGDVLARTGLKQTKLRRMVREGEFPRPRKLGGVVVWKTSEVDAWADALFS